MYALLRKAIVITTVSSLFTMLLMIAVYQREPVELLTFTAVGVELTPEGKYSQVLEYPSTKATIVFPVSLHTYNTTRHGDFVELRYKPSMVGKQTMYWWFRAIGLVAALTLLISCLLLMVSNNQRARSKLY